MCKKFLSGLLLLINVVMALLACWQGLWASMVLAFLGAACALPIFLGVLE